MKKLKFLLFLCVFFLAGCSAPAASESSENTEEVVNTSETLSVHFIDVGQGDAQLITIGSHAMLIDAGDNSMGTTVQLYLQKQGISSLDYVIGTHPDSDHIGGLDVIIYKFDCDKILMPDCTNDTATYRDVIDSMEEKGYQAVHPSAGTKYKLGDASFTITGPVTKYEETNDNSISLRLVYGKTSFLFMGDVTSDTEPDVISHNKSLHSDVLKVAHHGSKYSTSEAFISAVNPSYAIISCAEDNQYGFPSARVLNLLRSSNVEVFRTDEQGSILAQSNGKKIQWSASPSTEWKAGENTQSADNSASPDSNISSKVRKAKNTYILNTNTKKFHTADCRYAKSIAQKNAQTQTCSRSTLIQDGYEPCGYCKP